MTSMPCLIMQYKPYIVEQSSMGASQFCMYKDSRHPWAPMFISKYKLLHSQITH